MHTKTFRMFHRIFKRHFAELRLYLGEQLFIINQKLQTIMDQNAQTSADLAAILGDFQKIADAQTADAQSLVTMGQELQAIRDEEASGADQSATVAALDDLKTKFDTAAQNAANNSAALAALVQAAAAPASSGSTGNTGDSGNSGNSGDQGSTGTGDGSGTAAPTLTDKTYGDAAGETIVVSQAGDVPAVGEKVTVNGGLPSLSSYTLNDGSVLSVNTDGTVAGFVPAATQTQP